MIIRHFQDLMLLIAILASLLFFDRKVAAEEVLTRHDGLSLNGKLNLAKGKNLNDGVVLMVHGTLAHNDMDTIRNLAEVLNERGFNTLAINLSLGIDDRHGMYDCKVPHRHKHLDALDEIAEWLKWLEARGAGDIVLLGHSRGGNQVTRFSVERRNPKLAGLVMLAPSQGGGGSPKSYATVHGQPLNKVMPKAKQLVKSGKGGELMLGVGILYCPGADVAAETFAAYYNQDPRDDTVKLLPELKIPALVIVGGEDTVVRGLPKRIKPMVDGRNLFLAVVEDADHFFLDLFAEDVADHIEDFILRAS